MAYDDLLRQYDGSLKLRYTLDAAGRSLSLGAPEIVQDNYKSEGGVALTIDADIQRAAQRAMKDVKKGAAVVMDVETGDIKASVSMPAYDANNLADSLHNPDGPFVNRAFSQYSVGSTFKLGRGCRCIGKAATAAIRRIPARDMEDVRRPYLLLSLAQRAR